MVKLQVELTENSYPIFIERNLLGNVGKKLSEILPGRRFAVIADNRVKSLYGDVLLPSLASAGLEAEIITFEPGEASKTLKTLGMLAGQMVQKGFDRKSVVIGFGGGVTGDLAGFLAASYMRGVDFVQIPTTLLAQVDSSVGGKTGVDIVEGKNLLGAFYQPKAVFIDGSVLITLEHQELLGGLAEVIKHAIIKDPSFFDFLDNHREKILALDAAAINEIVATCCRIKAEVVAADEKEKNLRRILNFGHTFGHCLESVSNYKIIHGLGVSMGMVTAARLAVLLGIFEQQQCDRIVQLLTDYGLPTKIPVDLDRKRIKSFFKVDKKSVDGVLSFVLPTSIGEVVLRSDIEEKDIDTVLANQFHQ